MRPIGYLIAACVIAATGIAIGRATAPTTVPAHPKPAIVAAPVSEASLTTVTLTGEAVRRLGIVVVSVENRPVSATRAVGGELVAPPGRAVLVTAPVAGTLRAAATAPQPGTRVRAGQVLFYLVPLAPVDRDQRAQAERAVVTADARYRAANLQKERAELLAREKVGAERTAEDAVAAWEGARADVDAAKRRLSLIAGSPLDSDVALPLRAPHAGVLVRVTGVTGQLVAVGAPLVEIADTRELWVRVPLVSSDRLALAADEPAAVQTLGAPSSTSRLARPVVSPPTADVATSTVDQFYALSNDDGSLRPGERVSVQLPLRGAAESLVVPWSAVVFDAYGGSWVYEAVGSGVYTRRRVEARRFAGDRAVVTRGLATGGRVVAIGAGELFGTEFGAGK